eukprot:COSAG05_NODE_653_length_8071_cov_220.994982_7_plen_177_part_00
MPLGRKESEEKVPAEVDIYVNNKQSPRTLERNNKRGTLAPPRRLLRHRTRPNYPPRARYLSHDALAPVWARPRYGLSPPAPEPHLKRESCLWGERSQKRRSRLRVDIYVNNKQNPHTLKHNTKLGISALPRRLLRHRTKPNYEARASKLIVRSTGKMQPPQSPPPPPSLPPRGSAT